MSVPADILTPKPQAAVHWALARRCVFLIAPLLLFWLVVDPAHASKVFWYAAIPILPATFFVNPALWRGVCPMATLSEIGNRLGRQRSLPPSVGFALNVAGLALFEVMVPARHFVFNQNGRALAVAVVMAGGLALALGTVFAVRSAFCNALCPILPIELLYGMAPLVPMKRGRCATCTVCMPRGCIDLAKQKAVPQRLGPARRTARWMATPYGLFFAALPGFIIGYNHVKDGPLSTAGAVYAATLGWSLASASVAVALVSMLRLSSRLALLLLAAAAGGLFYWYAGPATMTQLAAPAWLAVAIRILGIGMVTLWLARAVREPGPWAAPEGHRVQAS